MKQLVTAVLICSFLVILGWKFAQRKSVTEKESVSHVTAKPKLPERRVPNAKPVPAGTRKTNQHPATHYDRPEKIRSFFEPALQHSYEIYFSLIGPHRRQYSITRAGFDSEANAVLARETVETATYLGNTETLVAEGKAVLFAMAHLAKSNSGKATQERDRVIHFLKRRAEAARTARERMLALGDLTTFYDLMGQEWDGSTL